MIDLDNSEYAGCGYFREKAPRGDKRPTIHAPQLIEALRERISKLEAENKTLRKQARCGHNPWPNCTCGYRGPTFVPKADPNV